MSKVSTKKAIALVTGAILATGVGLYLFKSQGKTTKGPGVDASHIDRETIIKVLKELKKELFTVFQNFAAVAANIKQQSMGRARPEDIKMMLLEQPMFRGEIEQVEDMVYASFNITRQQIQHYCQNVYREDQTIQELQKSMKDSFDRSFTGLGPDPKTEIPAFLTAEKTFEILERVMTESALKLNEKLLELQERGEQINFQSPRMMEIMQSLKMDSSKKEILAEYGLDKFEDPGSKILQYATQIYSQNNQGNFNAKMKQLDMKYQAIMEQLIMSGPMSHEELKHRMEPVAPQPQNIPFQEEVPEEEPKQQQEQPQQEAPVVQVEQPVIQEVQQQPVEQVEQHEEVAEQSQ